MIKHGDIIGYKKKQDMKEVILERLLSLFSEKYGINIVKLPSKKATKIAVDSSVDSESEAILATLLKGNASDLKKLLPVEGRTIKPLYLFLDEEILLFAKIKGLKFNESKKKKSKTALFLDDFEKKHPEAKRATVNSLLGLYK
jgi:tRNA(Ile)-lysidine synthase TilS/MesJ